MDKFVFLIRIEGNFFPCILQTMKFSIFDYLRQSLIYPTKTGSIAPSCEELSDLITDTAELHRVSTIVEFGTGTGVFTEKILKKMSRNATFFALEINPAFVRATKKRCPEAIIYNDSAENVRKHLEKHEVDSCDCVISGLPWAVFSPKIQDTLLATILDILKPGGTLLTMAYVHGLAFPAAQRFKDKLYNAFSTVKKSRTVWSNLPPAFVYWAKK